MPDDPEAGATSSKLTCQCITPLCNAMILKILRCVDWWLTHSCLLDVDLLANKMPTKVCVSAQLCMRPHVVHHTSRERKRDIWFVWKEIAFWNLWCILCAFHCSCSQSWWGTLPNKEECAALVQVQSCLFFYCNPKEQLNFATTGTIFLFANPKYAIFRILQRLFPFFLANPTNF